MEVPPMLLSSVRVKHMFGFLRNLWLCLQSTAGTWSRNVHLWNNEVCFSRGNLEPRKITLHPSPLLLYMADSTPHLQECRKAQVLSSVVFSVFIFSSPFLISLAASV